MQKKSQSPDLAQLNQELLAYVWPGYDLHFVHGWFTAYLSSPSDSEEDLLIPSYLIIDESKIADEQQFSRFIDKLVAVYSALADSIYEQNKLIRPLVDFTKPNSFDPLTFDAGQRKKLCQWLYGYLTGYLAIGTDITEYAYDHKLLDDKFFPALFTLCVAFFQLAGEIDWYGVDDKVKADFSELEQDLKSMWESEEDEGELDEVIAEATGQLDLADIVGALNDIFYVVRVCDEHVHNQNSVNNSLLGKLATKH